MVFNRFKPLLQLCSIVSITMITIYIIHHDINSLVAYVDKVEESPYPNFPGIIKIDVGQGEDSWVLTEKNEVMYFSFFYFK
jgi:hypothetical protein